MKIGFTNTTLITLSLIALSLSQSSAAAQANQAAEPQKTRTQKFLDGYTHVMQKYQINKALTGVYLFSSSMAIARAYGYNPDWGSIFTATDAVGTLQGLGMQRLQTVINKSNFDEQPDPENALSSMPQERLSSAKKTTRFEQLGQATGQACEKMYDNMGNVFAVTSATSACYGLYKVSNPSFHSPAGVQWAQGIHGLALAGASVANDTKELVKQKIEAAQKAERDRRHTAGEGLELQSISKPKEIV